jgi:methyltransferase (TIGR00027 family)
VARTNDDSWNLANSVGATATMVAAARAAASRGSDPIAYDPFAEHLVRAVGSDFFTQLASGELAFDAFGDATISGWMPDLFGVRTRYFDEFVTSSSRAGIRQTVNVASGLDSRAYRLEWPVDAVLYEIDQHEVIDFKRSALMRLGAAPEVELHTVGADLRQDWSSVLLSTGFDALAPSAWIVEGLMIGYLPGDAQDRLLQDITKLSAPGSRLVADHVPGSFDTLAEQMRQIGQDWRAMGFDGDFGDLFFSGADHNDVQRFLRDRGWTTTGVSLADLFTAVGVAGTSGSMGDGAEGVMYLTATRQ